MKFLDGFRSYLKNLFAPETYNQLSSGIPMDNNDIQILADYFSTEKYNRLDNYRMYDLMDAEHPICCVALDFLSDLITQGDDVLNSGHKVIMDTKEYQEEGENKKDSTTEYRVKINKRALKKQIVKIKDAILREKVENAYKNIDQIIFKFENRTKIKTRLRDFVRKGLKYGDYWVEIIWGEVRGTKEMRVADFHDLNTYKMKLNITDDTGKLNQEIPYIFEVDGKSNIGYEPHKILRFQFGNSAPNEYGRGLFFSGRKLYNRIDAMESGMVIGRLVRSHLRYLFKVDVTGMTWDKGLEWIRNLKTYFTKKKVTDSQGNIKNVKIPLSADEDIYFPVKRDSPSDVKVLEGDTYISYIDDVYYFLNQLVLLARIPQSLLQTSGSRNAIAEQDTNPIRFAKSLQANVKEVLKTLYKMELTAHGITEDLLDEIDIIMPEIDSVSTVRKFDIERVRAEIVKIHSEAKVISKDFMRENILYLTEKEIEDIKQELTEEEAEAMEKMKQTAEIEKSMQPEPASSQTADPKVSTRYTKKKNGKKGNSYTTTKQTE